MAVSGAVGGVALEHGLHDVQAKYLRWLDLSPPPLCAPVIYHQLLLEVESAYVHGDYFPALTGACCLGERVLNHLLLELRDNFRSHSRYKEIHGKDSCQNWGLMISLLGEWQVLSDKNAAIFTELGKLRDPSVHFGSVEDCAAKARTAVQLVYDVTASLFGIDSGAFFVCRGEFYVAAHKEADALVRAFILPHCTLVGYRHRIEGVPPRLVDYEYDDGELTDEEFCSRREAAQGEQAADTGA